MNDPETSAWFAGPKGENGDWFAGRLASIVSDYYSWRRNYFPEDGLILDAEGRRAGESFQDRFDDRLFELLARLKADFPFQSPRYAAHMVSEPTMPAIAGYFAAMLYNPNNVTLESAPVTVRLELEAAKLIARMVGYGQDSWAHLTSGGTIANLEALWIARTVKYLPLVVQDMRMTLGLAPTAAPFGCSPDTALQAFSEVFDQSPTSDAIHAYLTSEHNVVERGLGPILAKLGSQPFILAPETQHYSIRKILDLLGFGRRSLVRVRVDSDFRMDLGDLEGKLDAIERSGDHVVAVIPVIGTTEEGAIDPLDGVLALRARRKQSFWIHADAAYGGYLRTVILPDRTGLGEPLTTVEIEGKALSIPLDLPAGASCDALEMLGESDSVTVDPHKLGYAPYPAGAVCFKSDIVKPLARQDAPYIDDEMGDVQSERRSENVGLYIAEGSKPGAAAASVWLTHTLIPLDRTGHGRIIQDSIRNASELYALLNRYPSLSETAGISAVPLCPPGSNIVCFAFRTAQGRPLQEMNALNHAVFERFTLSGRSGKHMTEQPFFLSRTTLKSQSYSLETVAPFLDRLGVNDREYVEQGVFLLRSVVMNPWYGVAKRRGRYFVSELVESLYRTAGDLAGSTGPE